MKLPSKTIKHYKQTDRPVFNKKPTVPTFTATVPTMPTFKPPRPLTLRPDFQKTPPPPPTFEGIILERPNEDARPITLRPEKGEVTVGDMGPPAAKIPDDSDGNPSERRKRSSSCHAQSPNQGRCGDEINDSKRSLHLYIYYVNNSYDEKEQYVIYDLSSFIADVGGFMGLLLGFSIHSMVEMIERWWQALTARQNVGK